MDKEKRDRIELYTVIGMLIFFLIVTMFVRSTYADEQACYDKIDGDYLAPVTVLKSQRRRARQCETFGCFYHAAPNNRKKLTIYVSNKLPSQVLFGTLGWSKSVAVVRNYKKDRLNALLISAGVEASRLRLETEPGFSLSELINDDLLEHDAVSWENKCLRRQGIKVKPFLELVKIPRLK